VLFDNLVVTHNSGPVVEETHYYPFGLTMEGISSHALKGLNYPENKKGYNGNELQSEEFADGNGLELYDFNARTYDPQLGRFIQIDPLLENGQESLTPYHFAYNNPPLLSDPDGKLPIIPFIIFAVGLLLASKPAVAPTGHASDRPAIKQAYDNYGINLVTSILPAGKAEKVSVSLFTREGAKELAKEKLTQEAAKKVASEVKNEVKELVIDGNKHPESAKHAQDALDNGFSGEGTVDRSGASSRRRENIKNVKTETGKDRDEFPPAVLKPAGRTSVRTITSGDNRGAGASIGQQLKNVPDNTRVQIKVINLNGQ
jgi:RHS repeat-associated protein